MDLLGLVFVLAMVGLFVYLVVTYIPMPEIFKTAITILAVVVVLFYLFRLFADHLPNLIQ